MTITVQETVQALLAPLCSGRVYPNTAPDKPTCPYIVYSRVASAPEVTLDNLQPIQQTRLQVDVFDKTYSGSGSLAQSVITAMCAQVYPVTCTQLLEQDQYEPEVKLHRTILDFSIWSY